MIRIYLLLLAIIAGQSCFAQTAVDSAYIEQYPHKMMVKAFLSRNSIEIGHNEKDYSPNNPTRLGIGFSLKNTVINLSYSFGLFTENDKDYGKTKSADFQIHNYGRRFITDLFYQDYKGFYNEEGKTVTTYPDTSVQLIGGEWTYVYNHRQFSAKAAFEQTEKQLQSAGSFLLGGGAYYYKLRLEDALDTDTKRIKNFQLGVNAGYGYTWVINEHWLMSGIGTAGITVGNETNLLEDGKVKLYPSVFARGSAGYHKNDWGVSLTFFVNNKLLYYTKENFTLTSVNMQIAYIKHFDNPFRKK
jgi:hypothetical protein